MDQPVSVPVTPVENREVKQDRAHNESQILDEGLDIAGYRRTHDSPYVADYFGLRDFYKTNPDIAQQVDEITEDIIEQTQGESLVYAAKQILDQVRDEMNLSDDDTGLFRIKKALELLRARRKLRYIDSMRAKAVSDIENQM